jgi:CHAT domain-containing protein
LLAPVADMIEGKDLVIVPSQKLSSLPFQLLVSAMPPEASADGFAEARWLIREHAITVLPSVAALEAPRRPAGVEAERKPYLGFANPLLTGRAGDDLRAFDRRDCGAARPVEPLLLAGALPEATSLFRGASADVDAVRRLEPLPETADEACAIAAALGSDEVSVRLGASATEAAVKQLSEERALAEARILHFATHGLVSGDLSGLAEPAIVLTPPDKPSEIDDGLLTSSEVTTLKLDADWVILSACNTASGDGGGEALSGLARAFFYAGARALMVSHWPVNSDAAVSLATGAVEAITAEPDIGRAEALRRAMVAEIGKGGRHADPVNWAPFVLVGASR